MRKSILFSCIFIIFLSLFSPTFAGAIEGDVAIDESKVVVEIAGKWDLEFINAYFDDILWIESGDNHLGAYLYGELLDGRYFFLRDGLKVDYIYKDDELLISRHKWSAIAGESKKFFVSKGELLSLDYFDRAYLHGRDGSYKSLWLTAAKDIAGNNTVMAALGDEGDVHFNNLPSRFRNHGWKNIVDMSFSNDILYGVDIEGQLHTIVLNSKPSKEYVDHLKSLNNIEHILATDLGIIYSTRGPKIMKNSIGTYDAITINIESLTSDTISFGIDVKDTDAFVDGQIVLHNQATKELKPFENKQIQKVVFDNLKEDTAYELAVLNKSGDVKAIVPFKTFKKEINFEVHYFVDLMNAKNGHVPITIIGNVGHEKTNEFKTRRYMTHTNVTGLLVDSLKVKIDGSFEHTRTNDELEDDKLVLRANEKDTYFKIDYISDKSYRDYPNNFSHGCEGIVTENYMMLHGEQFFFLPRDNGLETTYSFVMPPSWKYEVGAEYGEIDNLFENEKTNLVLDQNFFYYNPEAFNVKTTNIQGFNVITIVEKGIHYDFHPYIVDICNKFIDIWGSPIGEDRYALMKVNDRRPIFAGETNSGQGSSIYALDNGQMIRHQIYHLWNHFKYGIPWDDHEEQGLWKDGFNDYYVSKIYGDTDAIKSYYNQFYRDYVNQGRDMNMLAHFNDLGMLKYFKGCIYAYAMDKEIQAQTNGEKSLDDVLKYLWADWHQNGKTGSYDKMLAYINEITPHGLDDWWEKYVVNNEHLILSEFE